MTGCSRIFGVPGLEAETPLTRGRKMNIQLLHVNIYGIAGYLSAVTPNYIHMMKSCFISAIRI
jgi:hypothetical protein